MGFHPGFPKGVNEMAKDFAELKARVDYYTDDTMVSDTAMLLFNQCSEDLAHIAGYAKSVELAFDKNAPTLALPLDFLEAIELKFKKTGDTDYLRILPIGLVQPQDVLSAAYITDTDSATGYEIFGDAVEIRSSDLSSGTLLIRYYAHPPDVAALSDVPVIKHRFHDLYALFAAAKYFQNYQDELQAKGDYWNEYQMKRAEMELEFLKVKSRATSKTVYQYRRWS